MKKDTKVCYKIKLEVERKLKTILLEMKPSTQFSSVIRGFNKQFHFKILVFIIQVPFYSLDVEVSLI